MICSTNVLTLLRRRKVDISFFISCLVLLSRVSSQDLPLYFPEPVKKKARQIAFMSSLERIVGGSPVETGAYPFFVRIDIYGDQACGGSLIAPDIVLTAAHCNAPGLSLVVGGTSASYVTDGPGVPRNVSQALPHPDFRLESFYNDFMLLKLSEPVEGVSLVKLRIDDDPPIQEGAPLIVFGLGYTSQDGGAPSSLLQVTVNKIPSQDCTEDYAPLLESDGLQVIIDDNLQFCAGSEEGGRDSCTGDSGGPIIDETFTQVGVVSFGFACGKADFPGAYAKLSGVKEWLKESICSMTNFPTEDCTSQTDTPSISPTILSNEGGTGAPNGGTTPPDSNSTVNGAPTTPQPLGNDFVCIDFDDETFVVDGVDHEISCQWLRDRPIDRESICLQDNLAYLVCTRTCVVCEEGTVFEVRGSLSRSRVNDTSADGTKSNLIDATEGGAGSEPRHYIRSRERQRKKKHTERAHSLDGYSRNDA